MLGSNLLQSICEICISINSYGFFNCSQAHQYDYYRSSCPSAQQNIISTVKTLYQINASIAPSLLRLVFHDCFVQGCDASVLLDAKDGMKSEKESPPNVGLKGYDVIDTIKSRLKGECPGAVSCADIIKVATRDGVLEAGAPFYPVLTGRKDSQMSFPGMPLEKLPFPNFKLSEALRSFGNQGFDERESVYLLGTVNLPA